MTTRLAKKRNITPKIAVDILKKNGVEVSEEEAEKMLSIMYLFAENAVNQYFKLK
jgi:hypothetical protein